MHNQTSSSRDPKRAMQSQYYDVRQFANSPFRQRALMPKDLTVPNQIAYSHCSFSSAEVRLWSLSGRRAEFSD